MADGYAQATGRPAFLNLHTSAGSRQRHRQPHRTPGPTARRSSSPPASRTSATSPPTRCCPGRSSTSPSADGEVGPRGALPRRARDDPAPRPSPTPPSRRRARCSCRSAWTSSNGPGSAAEVGAAAAIDRRRRRRRRRARGAGRPPVRPGGRAGGDRRRRRGRRRRRAGRRWPALADALGAPVLGAPLHARPVFDPRHPLWAGMLAPAAPPPSGPASRASTGCCSSAARRSSSTRTATGSPVPEGTELLAPVPRRRPARPGPTRCGSASPAASRPSLAALARRSSRARRRRGGGRRLRRGGRGARERRSTSWRRPPATATARRRCTRWPPPTPSCARVPEGTAVVDEAITTGVYVRGFHHRAVEDGYFFCKGGGLGWGMPAACGVSLARDRAPVLCVVGDGSAHVLAAGVVDRGPRAACPSCSPSSTTASTGSSRTTCGAWAACRRRPAASSAWTSSRAVDFVALARSMARRRRRAVDARRRHRRRRRRRRSTAGRPAPAARPDHRTVTEPGRAPVLRLARRPARARRARDPRRHRLGGPRRRAVGRCSGRTGAGKTSLARIASLWLHPSPGAVEVARRRPRSGRRAAPPATDRPGRARRWPTCSDRRSPRSTS